MTNKKIETWEQKSFFERLTTKERAWNQKRLTKPKGPHNKRKLCVRTKRRNLRNWMKWTRPWDIPNVIIRPQCTPNSLWACKWVLDTMPFKRKGLQEKGTDCFWLANKNAWPRSWHLNSLWVYTLHFFIFMNEDWGNN